MALKKETILNIIGCIFIIFGIAAIINAIYLKDYYGILWFCYSGLIIIGISILIRNSYLLTAQLNIFTIPLILWTIDFVYFLAVKHSLFGIVDYFFATSTLIAKIISLQHLFTIPLSFYAMYLLKQKRKDAWKLSFLEIILIYIVSIILTSESSNINCVYRACVNFIPAKFYTITWFALAFLMVSLTNLIINKLSFLKKQIY